MGFIRFFSMLAVAVLAFSPSAQAIEIGTLDVPVSVDSGSYALMASSGIATDEVHGYLASLSKIDMTYTLSGNAFLVSAAANSSGASAGFTSTNVGGVVNTYPISPVLSSLPVFVTANINAYGNVVTLVVTNLSEAAVEFSSYFAAIIAASCNGVMMSYQVSSVPLPPALLLFASGLAGLAGFSRVKKARLRA